MKTIQLLLPFLAMVIFSPHCYRTKASKGGGQITVIPDRTTKASDIALPPGYKIELVASGLTFPSAIAFDENDQPYVVEAGYCYGEVWLEPKLFRVDKNGSLTEVAKGKDNGPWTGITFHNGSFYVAEGGAGEGGKILRVGKNGSITTLVEGLPSIGDHHTNGPVIKDGYIYFGQGTATNSGIVGTDNASFGWLKRHKDFHDIPCMDITVTGQNYETENVLTDAPEDKASTGPFSSFGTTTSPGQIIKGSVPCSGSIMRIPINGGKPELVAWGFRNPFGLAISPEGTLYTTDNSYDDRGSRPVWGTGDLLWEVKPGTWYGWPDYSGSVAIKNFEIPGKENPKPVLQKYPNDPPRPTAVFGVHSSSNGFDFSRTDAFGYKGEAFVAQFGDMAPGVGKVLFPVGFKVVRVNTKNGVTENFAVNKGRRNGPASWLKRGGLERPVAVKFDPSGNTLYVVDFGILKMTKDGAEPQTKTGVIWKITREGL